MIPTPLLRPVLKNRLARSCAPFAAGALLALSARAQSPAKPLTQEDLLKQIEAITPKLPEAGRRGPAPNTPLPEASPADLPNATASTGKPGASLFRQPPEAKPEKPEADDKKSKGPTEIVALEAVFDQKVHQAVFMGEVVVTDPEFNVTCDKLTAFLKHDDKEDANGVHATPPKPDDKTPPKSGGLEKAIAEADAGSIVTVTQDKVELDGKVTHNVGHGKRVLYDATTGDITFYGHPDVQQGINQCLSTAEGTIMILNRDGHMRVNGQHRTIIKDQGDIKK